MKWPKDDNAVTAGHSSAPCEQSAVTGNSPWLHLMIYKNQVIPGTELDGLSEDMCLKHKTVTSS